MILEEFWLDLLHKSSWQQNTPLLKRLSEVHVETVSFTTRLPVTVFYSIEKIKINDYLLELTHTTIIIRIGSLNDSCDWFIPSWSTRITGITLCSTMSNWGIEIFSKVFDEMIFLLSKDDMSKKKTRGDRSIMIDF